MIYSQGCVEACIRLLTQEERGCKQKLLINLESQGENKVMLPAIHAINALKNNKL